MAKATPAPAGYVPMRRGGKWIMLIEFLREDGHLDYLAPLVEGEDHHEITRRNRKEIILVAQQHQQWMTLEKLREELEEKEAQIQRLQAVG